jgi:hypothetical protein
VLREALGEERAERCRRERRLVADDVRDQPLRRALAVDGGGRRGDRRVRGKACLDLAELDPEPAHLDLRVGALDELELAVGAPPDDVAGPVQARARPARERVRQVALGGEPRAGDVPARDDGPADVELPGDADGHRLERGVEHVELHVRERLSDRRQEVAGRDGPRRDDVRLRRPVLVVEDRARPVDERRDRRRHPERLAGGHDVAERRGRFGGRALGDELERGRRREEPLDPVRDDRVPDRCRVARLVVAEQHERPSGRERREDFLEGDVEARRRELERHGRPPEPRVREVPADEVDERPVRHRDALRRAGRAGGVDDVGE